MSYSLAEIILAAGGDDVESAFWMKMLMLVIVVCALGIGSLIKTRANKIKDRGRDYLRRSRSLYAWLRWKTRPLKELKDKCLGVFPRTASAKVTVVDFGAGDRGNLEQSGNKLGRERDLGGGMEMLEVDFLVSVVENAKGNDKRDVMMRKFSFDELARRRQLYAVDSSMLRVYAMNKANLYDKHIQCEAMKELAERTAVTSG